MLERSIKGKKAKAVFYTSFNDIDVFIEDTGPGSKKLYEILLSKIFKTAFRVNTVFPLGGKKSVIDECKADVDFSRKKIFIVDGDLELLLGNNPTGVFRLFILKKYCIENYFIDENAILEVLDEEDIEQSKEQLKKLFDYENWKINNETILFDLFVHFAISHKYSIGIATVSNPISHLVSSSDGIIDLAKFEKRKIELISEMLRVIATTDIESSCKEIFERVVKSNVNPIDCISGKDYLLRLILMRMRQIVKFRADNSVIKQRLAMKVVHQDFYEILDYLNSY
ncbi:DUF4435 domain-containing protein [Leptospira dzoumogneensis]|uniref:DUF4435 domain-containing protein n=1 Tax=Leptospira dzoumogneensis TaxID=2484904 RepID=A0A4Z1AQF8_9LEPT|nr:DUF4435 domain-containing protein [Leptospira dzoumogneensis]TGM97314.1 DUF4435 domain-containing protein [Leptospira dzoumogneensis]